MNIRRVFYELREMRKVEHATLNPKGPGSVRIHLIPPRKSLRNEPSVIILNGEYIIPINSSWAIILSNFMRELYHYDGTPITKEQLEVIVRNTVRKTQLVFKKTEGEKIKTDLGKIIEVLVDIAANREPDIEIGQMSLAEYARYMTAPHRMDLMVSAMEKNGKWHCNQKCLLCYAAGQEQSQKRELSTKQWKQIIDKCRENNIPQLTFTGGEPTMREDIVELINYSQWFVTRLNTNGVKLTKELCQKLYEVSLDCIQITLYSDKEEIHNRLVGANNWNKTVEGIKNALVAGLNVSINTPLATLNKDYTSTLKFLKQLGIIYVSCSGVIGTGNAKQTEANAIQLSEEELCTILKESTKFCEESGMEISFTSPGWLSEEKLRSMNLTVPTCGACLSNMAIAPDGTVVPCQSWLDEDGLGNILNIPWKKIWNHPVAKKIRNESKKMKQKCPLTHK